MDWYEVAIIAVAILGVILGGTFAFKWRQGVNLLKLLGDTFTETANALEDKKLTKIEAIGLLERWQKVFLMVMLFVGKK